VPAPPLTLQDEFAPEQGIDLFGQGLNVDFQGVGWTPFFAFALLSRETLYVFADW
jgi:hypothetical protein